MKNRPIPGDDGRTVADMSGIQRQPLFLPRLPGRKQAETPSSDARPWEPSGTLNREERRATIFGALKAALLIGSVFLAGGALLIWFLLLVWN